MIRKEKKTAFRLLIGIGAALLIILIAVLILFGNELRSLRLPALCVLYDPLHLLRAESPFDPLIVLDLPL